MKMVKDSWDERRIRKKGAVLCLKDRGALKKKGRHEGAL